VVRDILAEIETSRAQVRAILANAEGFDAVRGRQLEANLRDVMERFIERYSVRLFGPQEAAFAAGQALAAEPLVTAGVTFAVPQVNRRALEVARTFQASLISQETEAAVRRISTELRLAVLRGDALTETLPRVAGALTTAGPFATLATRAEAITRTELGRIQSIATQAGLEEAKTLVPELQKQWQHSGNVGPWRRQGHVDAHDQVRNVDAPFRVREEAGKPFETLMYPRDPAASPSQTVQCGCLSTPYLPEWKESIEAARREQAEFLRRRRAA
jgi:hypothetical protein